MSTTSLNGIGWVFDNDAPVAKVKYALSINSETQKITGSVQPMDFGMSLWNHKLLTLVMDKDRKLDFTVFEANGNGYQITGKGMSANNTGFNVL